MMENGKGKASLHPSRRELHFAELKLCFYSFPQYYNALYQLLWGSEELGNSRVTSMKYAAVGPNKYINSLSITRERNVEHTEKDS